MLSQPVGVHFQSETRPGRMIGLNNTEKLIFKIDYTSPHPDKKTVTASEPLGLIGRQYLLVNACFSFDLPDASKVFFDFKFLYRFQFFLAGNDRVTVQIDFEIPM